MGQPAKVPGAENRCAGATGIRLRRAQNHCACAGRKKGALAVVLQADARRRPWASGVGDRSGDAVTSVPQTRCRASAIAYRCRAIVGRSSDDRRTMGGERQADDIGPKHCKTFPRGTNRHGPESNHR
jgi:hypothetical protein